MISLQSYNIIPSHEQRGRALIVTMTDDRPGWKQDVRSLHRLFESLKVTTKYVFDPDTDVCKIHYIIVHFQFGD